MTSGTLHAGLLDAIGSSIVSGEIPAGASMTLDDLQARYNISRTVARECMRILESAQMVVARRRFGIVVLPSQDWNPYDRNIIRWRLEGTERNQQLQYLTELRLGVEPMAAALAAVRSTEAERDSLRQAAAELKVFSESGRADRYRESDVRFHSVLLRSSRNYMYAALADPICEAISAQPLHNVRQDFPSPEAAHLHYRVMQSVCSGDSTAAEEAMRQILSDVRSGLTTIMTMDD
jgi:DNA-binding FadR family transcriptional regulator